MAMLPCLTLAIALTGWSDITLESSRGRVQAPWQQTIGTLDRPSVRTAETLRRYDLERSYRYDVDAALARLAALARDTPDPELVYALAELSWLEGQRLDRKRRASALDRYVDAVAYAYDFLFDPELAAGRQPTDPRLRLACDLYNGALDRLIRAARTQGPIEPGNRITLKVHGEEQAFRVELSHSPWKPEDVHELLMASDFVVEGLPSHAYQYGLGVPLIAVRRTAPTADGGDGRFYPPEMAFPLTAFLRPNSRLRDRPAGDDEVSDCTIELVDPVQVRVVGQEPGLAVEADLTTPLAYMWSRTDLGRYKWTGLLRPGDAAERAGLMLIRPYEPGKIPVVMVHGLISSPLAWIPMINDLLRDPRIQERYQFFLYLYPTGMPLPIAAAGLREALGQAEQAFNPEGSDPQFRQMVLLGHSMGGLLSHAMTVESGDRFWRLNSDYPIERIIGPADVLGELNRYLFFKPVPCVRRVVFLATPHRGSELTRSLVGRLGAGLISDPDHVFALIARLIKDNPDAFDRRQFRRLPSSIDTLESNSSLLLALLDMKPGPDVTYHSIIGNTRPGGVEGSTDGVVTYRSAHLEGVASERVVRSDHSVQKDQEAILEVHRILLEHLNEATLGTTATAAPASTVR